MLTDEQFEELKETLINSEKNYSIREVQKLIKDKYGVNYSYKQALEISKKKLNLNYGKPFPIYDKKPDNSWRNIKKNTTQIDLNNQYLAFLDSVGVQNTTNSRRTLYLPGTQKYN